ncbi:hypothetical protein BP5796_11260 [Coleophoma crateriformis]|uniref:Zn(2)-C6 fungal-type domain-containing protein n=1 Tax=Coleophoma crateriformis TaxID=565419 RepID=A0A3D8QI43_9HELO|nr:hypothetical protein BP5796_11260 [Coleophoma crateriformis]
MNTSAFTATLHNALAKGRLVRRNALRRYLGVAMNKMSSSSAGVKKKTLNACVQAPLAAFPTQGGTADRDHSYSCQKCRTRKIKCSGTQPCQYCLSKKHPCMYSEKPKTIAVPEEYLRELQARSLASTVAARWPPELAPQLEALSSAVSAIEPQNSHVSHGTTTRQRFAASQLAQQPPQDARPMSRVDERSSIRAISIDPTGQGAEPPPEAIGDEYRRFGHSSSWSFSRRIRTMITDSLGGPAIHDLNPIRDGAYGIPWQQNMIDLSGVDLPSEDYADYLTRTVILTLSPLYTLLDQKAFLDQLHQFYDQNRRGNMPKTGLWHIQMLIIFAFGTSILSREAGPLGPTGALYFSKAMEAMPDCHRLCVEPLISIEILCMISLFMQAMDMRFAAQLYIRQASCMAAANGLNRRYDEKRHTSAEFQYRTRLWWTTYVIERKLSSLIGVSPGLPDEDIALRGPAITGASEEELPMAFHVEISSQLGHILNGMGETSVFG